MTQDHRLKRIRRHFEEGIRLRNESMDACILDVLAATDLIAAAFRDGNKLLVFGNGGSAADSQHMVAEFTSRLTMAYERPGLPAIALTTDTSFLTAFTNDLGFEEVFSRQIQSLGKPGDVVLGISTSGNSPNVVRGIEYAKAHGMMAVSLTGAGGALAEKSDVSIRVPSTTTAHIQEIHLTIEHIICHLVERDIYGYEEENS